MQTNMKTGSFRISGMTCVSCQDRIERKLKSTVGIETAAVNFTSGSAAFTYNASVITLSEIAAIIGNLGYRVVDGRARTRVSDIIGTLIIILSLYMLFQGLGIGLLSSAFPLAEAGMGYGMLFVIGLVTSVHCAAMCGGINISQCMSAGDASSGRKGRRVFFPAILYNSGRVVSYTCVGALAGALGSVVSLSGRFQGVVQIAAGLFMVIMGINMLGIFPALRRFTPRMPKIFARKIGGQKAGNKNPLFIGLLNGLMPCGPLQAMQIYALSTGSPLAGAVSMFLFSMGTVPLMFGLGFLSSLLSGASKGRAFTRRVMRAGAMLVTVMGMTMLGYGLNLSGVNFDFTSQVAAAINPFASPAVAPGAAAPSPVIENGVQLVSSTLSSGRYPAISVQRGIPVKWTISAPEGSINGCNNRMIIREYGIEHRFRPGDNVIEFTPSRSGKFSYSCWMGMIRSSITVIDSGQNAGGGGADTIENTIADTGEADTAPSPAGVTIPAAALTLAELQEDGYQRVETELRDDGIDPAVIVVQKGIQVFWHIRNDSPDPGNSRLVFPAYYALIDMGLGDNEINFMAEKDFDFSTADNMFYGYVKVVDDLSGLDDADIEAIKAEVSEFETLIYPEAYFEQAYTNQGSCCGR
ncbi:MAG: sulfite exporter TauE/SafE family protein [Spirochaetales bacterium]|jgi:sulfite exporter TauE/SafE/plastocyanin domain-containing protein|nr:sulfite exporter TauE/SafE family protein [Spirochaetales bacterium]